MTPLLDSQVATFTGSSYSPVRRLRPPPIPKLRIVPGQTISSTLTHELRNPLTNINLAVEILKRMITDKEQQAFLEIIVRGTMRINCLVNDMVRDQVADEVVIDDGSVQHLLDEVITMAEDRISLKSILVRKYYSVQDFKKIVNRPEIKIAMTNIIINAIDAMFPGIGQLSLTTQFKESVYIVQIEDNGCGISQENLKHIFTPFFTTKTNGLGIGLAASIEILKKNNVSIDVESKENLGTRFTLSFDNRSTADNS